jgi:hypothetical protein
VPPPPSVKPDRKNGPSDAWAWISKTRAAELTGYSVRNFSERIQPRIDAKSVKGKGGSLRFDSRSVVRALIAYTLEQSRPKPEDLDPLLGSIASSGDPVLDEYRREATTEKRLKNAQTRGELVDRARLELAFAPAFAAAAKCGDLLVKRFGNDAGDLWNEGIETMKDAAMKALQLDDDAAK